MRLIRLASACALAGTLAACGTSPKGSVLGSEGGAIKAPAFVVRGKTVHDQAWIDETVEAGVLGLGWKRPAARPREWDRPLAKTNSEIRTEAPGVSEPATMPPAAAPKKKRWRDRLIPRFLRRDKPAPVEGG